MNCAGQATQSVRSYPKSLCRPCTWLLQAGRHEISVLAGGEPVAGSPFALDVAPGQLHPGSCSLSGPGVRSVQLGREMKLEVRLADCFGNSIADAGCIEAHDVQVSAQPVRGNETELRC